MPLRQNCIGSITLYMSNMDVWHSLRWMSASNMTLWCHYHSISDPESPNPNLGPTWPVEWYKGSPICPWDSTPKTQTLCSICLIWMYDRVWGGCLPQTWHNGVISTPYATQNPQIWGQVGEWIVIRLHPYALETANQRLKHFVVS